MTWVKLCGMTRREDVLRAVAVGADAVGVVLYEGSPRRVTPEAAASLVADLAIDSFLVTVDETPHNLVALARTTGVSGVQPHGHHGTEAATAAAAAGFKVLFPVPVGSAPIELHAVDDGWIPIFDTAVSGMYGGSGQSFAWELAHGSGRNVVIAGGLTPRNVARAIAVSGAWGVDVASGVEVTPGIKDHDLMNAFVEAAR